MDPIFSKIASYTDKAAKSAGRVEKDSSLKGIKLSLIHKVKSSFERSRSTLEGFTGREIDPKTLEGRAEKSAAREVEIAKNKMRQIEAKVFASSMKDLSRVATTAEDASKLLRQAAHATKSAGEGLVHGGKAAASSIKHLATDDSLKALNASIKITTFLSTKLIENVAKTAVSKAKDKMKSVEVRIDKLSKSEQLKEDLTAAAKELKESAIEYLENKATEVLGEDTVEYSKALKVVAKAKMKETLTKIKNLTKRP